MSIDTMVWKSMAFMQTARNARPRDVDGSAYTGWWLIRVSFQNHENRLRTATRRGTAVTVLTTSSAGGGAATTLGLQCNSVY